MDASWDGTSWVASLAMVVRDHKGTWVLGSQQKRLSNSALTTKIYALRMGLMLAKDQGWTNIHIAPVCQQDVILINQQDQPLNDLANIIFECREPRNIA